MDTETLLRVLLEDARDRRRQCAKHPELGEIHGVICTAFNDLAVRIAHATGTDAQLAEIFRDVNAPRKGPTPA